MATPADWQPGDDVIIPPPGSCGVAKDRVEKAGEDYYCLDWFMCLKKLPMGENPAEAKQYKFGSPTSEFIFPEVGLPKFYFKEKR